MSDLRPYLRCWLILALCSFMVSCGPPGPNDDGASSNDEKPIPDLGSEDRRDCGELGLDCVGPLNIGECIDGQCQPILGFDCKGPSIAPTCDEYCAAAGRTCAANSCAGATAWGWGGDLETAAIYCLDGYKAEAIALNVACDAPLEGLVSLVRCCCEYD